MITRSCRRLARSAGTLRFCSGTLRRRRVEKLRRRGVDGVDDDGVAGAGAALRPFAASSA